MGMAVFLVRLVIFAILLIGVVASIFITAANGWIFLSGPHGVNEQQSTIPWSMKMHERTAIINFRMAMAVIADVLVIIAFFVILFETIQSMTDREPKRVLYIIAAVCCGLAGICTIILFGTSMSAYEDQKQSLGLAFDVSVGYCMILCIVFGVLYIIATGLCAALFKMTGEKVVYIKTKDETEEINNEDYPYYGE